MKEQLVFEAKLDLGQFNSQLNQVKNTVSNVNKSINSSLKSASESSKVSKATEQSLDNISDSIRGVGAQLQQMKGMSLFDVTATVLGLKAVTKMFKDIKDSKMEKMGYTLVGSIEEAMDSLTKKMGQGANGGFVFGDSDAMKDYSETMKKYSDLQDELGEAIDGGNIKKIKELKELMKKLGLDTKGANHNIIDMVKTMGALKTMIAAVVGVIAGALAVLLPIAIIGTSAALSVSKLGDEIYHTAQRFNMSTEAFQEWSYIMERSGSSIDDLKGFLETLASEQSAVINGSEDTIATFEKLGLSAQEVASMGQEELFSETVKRIQNLGTANERSAVAYELFGDEASRLMNVLNMSNAEMQKAIDNYYLLGGAMSGELIQNSNSLQNSIANMKQAWQGISNTLAEVFIPIVQKVVNWLTKAFVAVNLFLRSIFGLDLKPASNSTDKAVSSTNKYTGGLKSAKKAAEELKRVTMGFDELNIVTDPNKGGSDSDSGSSSINMGGGAGFDTSFLEAADLNLESMYEWFDKYKTKIRDITAVVLTAVGIIGGLVALFLGNFILAGVLLAMGGIGIAIGAGEGGTWERWGKAIADAAKACWEAIKKFFIAAGEWIAGIPGWIMDNLIQPVIDWFVAMGETIVNGIVSAWNATIAFIKAIPGWIYENIILPVGNFFVGLWNGFVNGAIAAWNGIVNAFKAIGSWINNNVVQPVSNFISGMWNGFKSGASKAWEGIKSVFSGITTWFKDKFTQAWTAVKNVFSTGGKIFDGIKDGIANVFKTVVNGIIGGINKVIKVPFDAINGMLNKIRNVDILGVEPFKGFWKQNPLSVPQIPKLATGGIATRSVIANIGEAGKEAVLPLENNTQWMDTLADKIAARNGAPSKIVLQVGEKELGWATINSINSITKQTGGLQLTL